MHAQFAPPGPRIHVVGTSGSGKTTVAARAAAQLGIPYVELDAIHHGPNWVEIPDDEFRARVAQIVADEAWVIDGNYRRVRDLVWARATSIVWVDFPRWLIMAQVIWRSASRAITGQEMWHPGNREYVSRWLTPEHPIRWAWSTFDVRRQDYQQQVNPRWIRLRSRRDVSRWLDSLRR